MHDDLRNPARSDDALGLDAFPPEEVATAALSAAALELLAAGQALHVAAVNLERVARYGWRYVERRTAIWGIWPVVALLSAA
jgi:hypothetical protein